MHITWGHYDTLCTLYEDMIWHSMHKCYSIYAHYVYEDTISTLHYIWGSYSSKSVHNVTDQKGGRQQVLLYKQTFPFNQTDSLEENQVFSSTYKSNWKNERAAPPPHP